MPTADIPARDALPACLKPRAQSGQWSQGELLLRWSERRLEVYTPSLRWSVPLTELRVMELSRSTQRQRVFWLWTRVRHLLHVDFLARENVRVRVRAVAPEAAALDGLPFKELPGQEMDFRALCDAARCAMACGVKVPTWDPREAELSAQELARRARQQQSLTPEPTAERREPGALKQRWQQWRARRQAYGGATGGEKTKSTWLLNSSLVVGCLLAVLTLRFCLMHTTTGALVAVEPLPGDRALVVTHARVDDSHATYFSLLDLKQGELITRKAAGIDYLVMHRSVQTLEVDSHGLWTCNHDDGVRLWSVHSLEPIWLQMQAIQAQPEMIQAGLGPANRQRCDTVEVTDGLVILGGLDGRRYELRARPAKGIKPPVRKHNKLFCSQGLNTHAVLNEHLRLEGPGAKRRALTNAYDQRSPLGSQEYLYGKFVMDARTCQPLRLGSRDLLMLHYKTVERREAMLTRLDAETGRVLWTRPWAETAQLQWRGGLALDKGDVALFFDDGHDGDPEVIGLDGRTGRLRYDLSW